MPSERERERRHTHREREREREDNDDYYMVIIILTILLASCLFGIPATVTLCYVLMGKRDYDTFYGDDEEEGEDEDETFYDYDDEEEEEKEGENEDERNERVGRNEVTRILKSKLLSGKDTLRQPEEIGLELIHPQDINNNTQLILDCRSEEEYIKGHIRGAVNTPTKVAAVDYLFENSIPKFDTSLTIVFHCELSKQRGPLAYRTVQNMGMYKNLKLLSGGIKEFASSPYAHMIVGKYVSLDDVSKEINPTNPLEYASKQQQRFIEMKNLKMTTTTKKDEVVPRFTSKKLQF